MNIRNFKTIFKSNIDELRIMCLSYHKQIMVLKILVESKGKFTLKVVTIIFIKMVSN